MEKTNVNYIIIDDASSIPKYRQIIKQIKTAIRDQKLQLGDKLFSINQMSKSYTLSRDTVKKAYKVLTDQNIIESVRGKGFFIVKTDLLQEMKILFIINKLSKYKMQIFNAFINTLNNDRIEVDLEIYYCDPKVLKKILIKNESQYDYLVIMPHFKNKKNEYIECPQETLKVIKKIPAKKLIILDRDKDTSSIDAGKVYQDFESDIFEALTTGVERIKKYKKLILFYPDKNIYPYPKEILIGFERFCKINKLDCEILSKIYDDMEMKRKDLYITISEEDLISLVTQTRESSYILGKDIGIISYNDTPLKELLGITVISTNFDKLGSLAAEMILSKKFSSIKNEFNFINRFSA
jgi:DNA-binding transcriptional regulator YhcF (GntR family)